MQHSDKKLTIGLTVVVLSAVAALGCMRPKTYSSDDIGLGDASFALDKVKLTENGNKEKKAEVVGLLEGFSIPSKKRFHLQTCLKTEKIESPVAFAPFLMTGQGLSGKEPVSMILVTDKDGCLSWSEEVAYNFLGEEVYVPVTRALTAQDGSGQRGSQEIRLALNPWNLSGSATELLDLNQKDAVPEGVQVTEAKDAALYLSGKPEATAKQISVAKFAIASLPGPAHFENQKARVLQLTIQPAIRGQDALKKPVEFALSQARLELDAVLVAVVSDASGAEKRFQVWSSHSPIGFSKTDQGFNALIGFSFSPIEEENARYELLARVRPVPALEGLNAFEAIFTLGSHADLMNSYVLPEKIRISNTSDPKFSINESVKILEAPPVVLPPKPEAEPPAAPAEPAPAPVPADGPPPVDGGGKPSSEEVPATATP